MTSLQQSSDSEVERTVYHSVICGLILKSFGDVGILWSDMGLSQGSLGALSWSSQSLCTLHAGLG
jgi:hypothetical protein